MEKYCKFRIMDIIIDSKIEHKTLRDMRPDIVKCPECGIKL